MTRRPRPTLVLAAAGAIAALTLGCGSAARRPNVVPTQQLRLNPRLAEGQRVFMQYCNQCHVGGAAGLGPSLNDKPLPGLLVKLQVRFGFGAMPAFPKRVLNDARLDDVVRYLDYLRAHPDGPVRGG